MTDSSWPSRWQLHLRHAADGLDQEDERGPAPPLDPSVYQPPVRGRLQVTIVGHLAVLMIGDRLVGVAVIHRQNGKDSADVCWSPWWWRRPVRLPDD